MPRRFSRTCPLCGRPSLKNISTHLLQVHNLKSEERVQILKEAPVSSWQCSLSQSPSLENQNQVFQIERKSQKKRPNSEKQSNILPKPAKSRKVVQTLSTEPYPNFNFWHKFSLLVVGPTQSGKTYFVQQILENDRIVYEKNKRRRILWCYTQWQEGYQTMKKIIQEGNIFSTRVAKLV